MHVPSCFKRAQHPRQLQVICMCKYAPPQMTPGILPCIHVPAEVKSAETVGPVLIHVVTEKGRGYAPAESAADKMHGVVKFDPRTGQQQQSKAKTMAYTNYFADSLTAEAERDSRVVAVHAAMAGGTGLYRCVYMRMHV